MADPTELRNQESQQAHEQIAASIPPGAEGLERRNIELLYDAAGKAQSLLAGMEPLPPLELQDPPYTMGQAVGNAGRALLAPGPSEAYQALSAPQPFEQVPPEVGIPVLTLFSFFDSELAPSEAGPYKRDVTTLLQTNDGLLKLANTLHKAATDPALRASLHLDVPQVEAPPPEDTDAPGMSEEDVVSSMAEGMMPGGRRQVAKGDTLMGIARSMGAANDTEAMAIAKEIAANNDFEDLNQTIMPGDELFIGGRPGQAFDITKHATTVAQLPGKVRTDVISTIAGMPETFLQDASTRQRLEQMFLSFAQGEVELGVDQLNALARSAESEPASVIPRMQSYIEKIPPEVRQRPEVSMRVGMIEALLKAGDLTGAQTLMRELEQEVERGG